MTRAKNLKCVRCDETKPANDFVNDRTRTSGKFPWCKICVLESRRETKQRDKLLDLPLAVVGERRCEGCLRSLEGMHAGRKFCSMPCKEKVRRWRTFGLEPDEYRKLIESNKGRCPLCRRQVKKWVLDHNHDTGEVTGATCSICNQSLLAYSRHDLEVAERLVAYLERYPILDVLGGSRFVGPETLSQLARYDGWRKARGEFSVGLAQAPYPPEDDTRTAA